MKKNIIKKTLFTFLCMFAALNYASANPYGTGSGSTGSGETSTATGSSLTASSNGSENYVIGIRLSFYTSNGNQITSKDYLSVNYSGSARTQYGNGTPCGKVSGCAYSSNWQETTSFNTTASLTAMFSQAGYNVDIDNLLRSGNLSKNLLFSELLSSRNVQKAKTLFNAFGVNPDNYYDSSKGAYDLFLVWEPLGRVKYNGVQYVGTSHELSTFAYNINGTFCFANCHTGNGYSYAVGEAMTVNMGCAVNLDDSDEFGNKVAAKFSGSFSSRSYFGGRLDANTAGAVRSGCNTSSASPLRDYAVYNTTSALGVGILWYEEAIDINGGLGCYDVDSYYGKTNICDSISRTGTFNFSTFNNEMRLQNKIFPSNASNGITADWYMSTCGCPGSEGYNCTPSYNVASCTTSGNKTLTYQDSSSTDGQSDTYWQKCVFTDVNDGRQNQYNVPTHKWSSNTSALTYYDASLSSDYCKVYCIESVAANFDSNNPEVLAGSHFVWGWSTVNTTRTCKTESIDWDAFQSDLRAANEAVVQELAQNKLHDANEGKSWVQGSDQFAGGTETTTKECTNKYDWDNRELIQDGCAQYESNPNCRQTSYHGSGASGIETQSYTYECTGTSSVYSCTNYTYQGDSSESVTVAGITKTATHSDFTKCVNKNNPPSGNPVSGGNVSAAVNRVNSVIAEMNKCYDFANESVLNEQSSARISYTSENNDYNYSNDMKKSQSYSHSDTRCSSSLSITALTSCSGTSCSTTSKNMYNCTTHEESRSSNIVFTLQDGVYNYILKNPNGNTLKSIHSSDLGNYSSGTLTVNWLDIGYSNFPVPYYFSRDVYEGSLNINYSNLGHKNSTSTTTDVDRILSSTSAEYGNWSCGYKVTPELIGDPDDPDDIVGDINVIYREIDLYRPFPDIDASNRNTGANWCDLDSCAWNNSVSTSFILNNRDVTGDEIYKLEPMYTFVLTPSDIIKIRKYNDENTYTSYTGSSGGATYDFKCITGTGQGCRSDYLTELMSMLDTANYPGTCKNERQIYSTIAQFENCRY